MAATLERLRAAISDRYRIERERGRGGMATVFLAEDLKHHRPVAIKVLDPEIAAAVGPERFLREIETVARLSHPHILPLFDSGQAGGLVFYVMPYVEGDSLRDRLIREKQLQLDDALRIAREVAGALSYAHGCGVVHRDIKPENILLQEGHAVVADFGIARAVEAGGEALTATGIAAGTPAYMSPEQAAGRRDVDGRSDLYSLGCVLYEMLAGVPPFAGPTAESLAHQHLNVTPRAVTELRPTVPAGAARALERALAKTPADRFATLAQFSDALRAIELGSGPHGSTASAGSGTPDRGLLFPGGVSPRGRTIAVLPFENISAEEENEYFSDGLTEEIIATLSTLRSLKVISRTSIMRYKRTRKPLRDIASELQAQFILEGSVRRHGNDLRITAQLVDAVQDLHVWGERYSGRFDEVFQIQEAVATAIARALDLAVATDTRGHRRHAESVEAYQLYLKGRHQLNKWTRESQNKAIQLFEAALRLDPGYALAYAAIADAHATEISSESFGLTPREAGAKARDAALRALDLDDGLAEAHSALGHVRSSYDWEWDAAEREFIRALELNPSASSTYHWYSHLLISRRRFPESLAASQRALELNPLDAEMEAHLAFHHLCSGEYDHAIEHCRRGLEIDEGFHELHWFFAEALSSMGRYGEAIEPMERAIRLGGGTQAEWAGLARVFAGSGRRDKAEEILERLVAPSEERIPPSAWVAATYAALGDSDRALEWIEKAVEQRSLQVPYLGVWPAFRNLRDMPRYRDVLDRLGLGPPGANPRE